jgi:hypothetical protein
LQDLLDINKSLKLTEKKIESAVCSPLWQKGGAKEDFSERKLSIKAPHPLFAKEGI